MDTRADPVPTGAERPPGEAAPIAAEPGDDESVARPPSRRAAIVRTALVVGMLAIVFGVIVPRFVDYADVIAAFQALTLPQLLLMVVLAAGAWLVNGLLFTALIPGLSPRRGTEGYLILAGIGASVPMGPWNMAVVWIVLRGWGVSIQAATSGLAMYGVINQLSRLAIPLIALVVLTVTGQRPDGNGWAQVIAVLSAVIMVVATVLLVGIARSERVAETIARFIERARDRLFRRLGRTGGSDVHAAVRRFRDELGELLRTRGALAMVVGILGQLAWCGLLIVALRVVGVPAGVLDPAEVLAVFGLTVVITIIPIAPGGAGIPELLYIAGLSAIAGAEWEGLITAGVMLFRLFQWFLPIPLAWILLKVTRRGRPTLPTMGELRSFSRDEALPT